MPKNFRNGFYAGLIVALIAGVYLVRLWQGERQVQLHSANLLVQIEKKNWKRVGNFIEKDYLDQWGQDRTVVLERLREVFRALPNARIEAGEPSVVINNGQGHWSAKVTVRATGDYAHLVQERVNSLPAPFELEWRRGATWPWDWKLISVRNSALEISGYGQ